MQHQYGLELVESDPMAEQPTKIRVPLKPHQRAALAKSLAMERDGEICYNLPMGDQQDGISAYRRAHQYRGRVRISTNCAILSDEVGYGKTLTALSIIAASPVREIYWESEAIISSTHTPHSTRNVGHFRATLDRNRNTTDDKMFFTTLAVVPHGPVFVQWKNAIALQTNLKVLVIDALPTIRKLCPAPGTEPSDLKQFMEQYDVVLIKATSIKTFMDYYEVPYRDHPIHGFARVMVDEAHDILPKIPMLDFNFLWLISGTYQMIPQRLYSCRGLCNIVREVMSEDRMNMCLIKGNRDFVHRSFNVPPFVESYHLCHLPANFSMVQPFLHPSVMERINANDIAGAIRELGGSNETETDIVALVTRDIQRDISNKEREISYVESLDILPEARGHRLQILRADLQRLQERLRSLIERVSQLSQKQCDICLDTLNNPILLECTHVFCGSCIIHWIQTNMHRRNCPTCRSPIHCKKLTAIVNQRTETPAIERPVLLNKEDMLVKLIQDKPDGRFLVFSRLDTTFYHVTNRLLEANVPYAEIKGSTSQMMRILERFRNGELRVILLNTHHAGSGIDISCATDVVIFHAMGLDKTQAVGRAQRVGRTTPLHVHNLCYAHEM